MLTEALSEFQLTFEGRTPFYAKHQFFLCDEPLLRKKFYGHFEFHVK
jgi:hypothetical protein